EPGTDPGRSAPDLRPNHSRAACVPIEAAALDRSRGVAAAGRARPGPKRKPTKYAVESAVNSAQASPTVSHMAKRFRRSRSVEKGVMYYVTLNTRAWTRARRAAWGYHARDQNRSGRPAPAWVPECCLVRAVKCRAHALGQLVPTRWRHRRSRRRLRPPALAGRAAPAERRRLRGA